MIYNVYLFLRSILNKSRINLLKRQFHFFGRNVSIDFDTVFVNPQKIHLADNCNIYKGVYIKSRTSSEVGITIGSGVKIHEYTYIDDYGGKIHFDDNVGIGHHCVIGGHGGLYVGKHTIIAGLTYIVPANHIFNTPDVPFVNQGETKKGIFIGHNVWIGSGCIILDGITIGNNSVIGAGSIVTKDVPENVLALGQPAKVVRHLFQ